MSDMADGNGKETIKVKLEYIQEDIREIKQRLDTKYVTQTEFQPIKSLVYGVVGMVLTGVIGAMIALVII